MPYHTYTLQAGRADSLDFAVAAVLQLLDLGGLVALVQADTHFVSRSHCCLLLARAHTHARDNKRTSASGNTPHHGSCGSREKQRKHRVNCLLSINREMAPKSASRVADRRWRKMSPFSARDRLDNS